MKKMSKMAQQAKTMSEQAQQRQKDADKPVDTSDPKWEPIHGITLDKYAELTAHMGKNSIVETEEVNKYVEANGVPEGKWLEVLNGWTAKIGKDIDIRTRYGIIYGDLFAK
jgi:hypothetical protein